MRVLADENQHPVVVARLRNAGYTVEWIRETSPGSIDEVILQRPDINDFVFITDDRDFGDLIFNRGYPAPRAILYNRLNRAHPDAIADRLLVQLTAGGIDGFLTTITRDGIRTKPFPAGASHG